MRAEKRKRLRGVLKSSGLFAVAAMFTAVQLGGPSGCGAGTTASGGGGGSSETGSATVTGILTQPNGDPLPGALVYVEEGSGSAALIVKSKKRLTDDEGNTCEDPPSGITTAASDCTAGDGSFSFQIPDCSDVGFSGGNVTVHFRLGAIVGSFTAAVNCSGSANDVGGNQVGSDTVKNLRIAVCSGEYDRMENVLARMGFAPSDTDSDGDQDFNGYDGSQTESFNYFRGHVGADADYPSCCELLKGSTVAITDRDGNPVMDAAGNPLMRSLGDYDIAFTNCGSGCESGGFTPVIDDLLFPVSQVSAIQDYVNNGGALYVTDLSYDFIEQAFPGQIDYLLGGNGAGAETLNAAQMGEGGAGNFEPLPADVMQTSLKDYLESVAAGNPGCGIPSGTGSLNADETVNLCDFLGSWAVMIGMETTNAATTWIRGAAEFMGGPDTDAAGNPVASGDKIPLTVSYSQGSGAVLYSSYHTDNSPMLTTEFLPQERVLQFLVLELFGAL